jgi:hypothetical protein
MISLDMRLHISVIEGEFVIARLPFEEEVDITSLHGFFSVTRSGDELSLICLSELAPCSDARSEGWRCMRIEESLGVDTPGVLQMRVSW